jgi:hypothetical protein
LLQTLWALMFLIDPGGGRAFIAEGGARAKCRLSLFP